MSYYMGLVGRPWHIQCIYLYNGTHINKRRRKEKGKRERLRRCGAAPLGLCLVKTSTIVKTEGCRIVHKEVDKVLQTSFGHISISSSTIPTVSMAPKSP